MNYLNQVPAAPQGVEAPPRLLGSSQRGACLGGGQPQAFCALPGPGRRHSAHPHMSPASPVPPLSLPRCPQLREGAGRCHPSQPCAPPRFVPAPRAEPSLLRAPVTPHPPPNSTVPSSGLVPGSEAPRLRLPLPRSLPPQLEASPSPPWLLRAQSRPQRGAVPPPARNTTEPGAAGAFCYRPTSGKRFHKYGLNTRRVRLRLWRSRPPSRAQTESGG